MELVIFKRNSMVLTFVGLTNHEDQLISDATVNAVIKRGVTTVWSGVLLPVLGVAGNYEIVIAPTDSASMVANEDLSGVITATAGGLFYEGSHKVVVRDR